LSYKFGEGAAITDEELEALGGEIREGDIPVLRTDQTKKWNQQDFYSTSPYLTRRACEWLVNKKVKANVFDFSIEYSVGRRGPSPEPKVHPILLSKNIYNIEYVTNLDKLTEKTFTIVALPLNLVGVEGSPARVIAIQDGPPAHHLSDIRDNLLRGKMTRKS
ncbi:MAG: cyclase family protein, partial [Candidatus Bathyarchaeota archaeon]